jgi:hypothetical protein
MFGKIDIELQKHHSDFDVVHFDLQQIDLKIKTTHSDLGLNDIEYEIVHFDFETIHLMVEMTHSMIEMTRPHPIERDSGSGSMSTVYRSVSKNFVRADS